MRTCHCPDPRRRAWCWCTWATVAGGGRSVAREDARKTMKLNEGGSVAASRRWRDTPFGVGREEHSLGMGTHVYVDSMKSSEYATLGDLTVKFSMSIVRRSFVSRGDLRLGMSAGRGSATRPRGSIAGETNGYGMDSGHHRRVRAVGCGIRAWRRTVRRRFDVRALRKRRSCASESARDGGAITARTRRESGSADFCAPSVDRPRSIGKARATDRRGRMRYENLSSFWFQAVSIRHNQPTSQPPPPEIRTARTGRGPGSSPPPAPPPPSAPPPRTW